MNLYRIERHGRGWDHYLGHVIAASSEAEVRAIAAEMAADEGAAEWNLPSQSTIELIGLAVWDVPKGIVLSDFNAG